jgi:hypothetical protein
MSNKIAFPKIRLKIDQYKLRNPWIIKLGGKRCTGTVWNETTPFGRLMLRYVVWITPNGYDLMKTSDGQSFKFIAAISYYKHCGLTLQLSRGRSWSWRYGWQR